MEVAGRSQLLVVWNLLLQSTVKDIHCWVYLNNNWLTVHKLLMTMVAVGKNFLWPIFFYMRLNVFVPANPSFALFLYKKIGTEWTRKYEDARYCKLLILLFLSFPVDCLVTLSSTYITTGVWNWSGITPTTLRWVTDIYILQMVLLSNINTDLHVLTPRQNEGYCNHIFHPFLWVLTPAYEQHISVIFTSR